MLGAAACLARTRVIGIDIDAEPARVAADVITRGRGAATLTGLTFDDTTSKSSRVTPARPTASSTRQRWRRSGSADASKASCSIRCTRASAWPDLPESEGPAEAIAPDRGVSSARAIDDRYIIALRRQAALQIVGERGSVRRRDLMREFSISGEQARIELVLPAGAIFAASGAGGAPLRAPVRRRRYV